MLCKKCEQILLEKWARFTAAALDRSAADKVQKGGGVSKRPTMIILTLLKCERKFAMISRCGAMARVAHIIIVVL